MNKTKTIIYNKDTDNPSYKDIIDEKIVKNELGEVNICIPKEIPKSIQDVTYVLSGRGLYRGWISNLQKSIRRGKIKDAIQSAYECLQFDGPFFSHVINRVCKVIISEDIGCANPYLVHEAISVLKTEDKKEKETKLYKLITKMCNGYKSRIVDHSLHLVKRRIKDNKEKVYTSFEEALDDLKQGILVRNIYRCVNALFSLVSFGNETCKEQVRMIDKDIKPKRMNKKIYIVWNTILCNKEFIESLCKNKNNLLTKLNDIVKINVSLFEIWYSNVGNESILNLIHALCNLLLINEIFDFDYSSSTTVDTPVDTPVWIMSASYDKHVRRWKTEQRNSLEFFLQYGVKLDKLHPNLSIIDEELYVRLLTN